jgi:hypothetical protein
VIAVNPDSDEPRDVYKGLSEVNPDAKIAYGFERAYLGYTIGDRPVAVYEYEECINIVKTLGEMNTNDATAHFFYTTLSQCGDQDSPIFVRCND